MQLWKCLSQVDAESQNKRAHLRGPSGRDSALVLPPHAITGPRAAQGDHVLSVKTAMDAMLGSRSQ